MGPFKASRLDSFQAVFFQKQWGIMGKSISKKCLDILNNKESTKDINDTLIVLIPKVENPEIVNQLRPISLYNVVFN